MRYVPRDALLPDMILARAILGSNGEVMMQPGATIRMSYVNLMRKYGINGAFISDSLSEGVVIPEILDDELRTYAISRIYGIYSHAMRRSRYEDAGALLEISAQIVDVITQLGGDPPSLLDIKSYDYSSYFHALHVSVLATIIGQAMGLERGILCELTYAGMLHDIGKMFIDARIVTKTTPLSYEEMELIRRHPQDGRRFIRQKYPEIGSEGILRGILEHHERLNGSGYPYGLSSLDITDFAKILAVADVYDAMTSERPYRAPAPAVQALAYLREGKDSLFDEDVVDAFLLRAAPYPAGTCVQLSNGDTALVIRNNIEHLSRPDLRVFRQQQRPVKPFDLSLSDMPPEDLTVAGPVDF